MDHQQFDRDMKNATFRNCALGQARFEDVDLSHSVFSDVNLRGAHFTNVNLTGVVIDDANIAGLTIAGRDIAALIREAMPSSIDRAAMRNFILLMHDDATTAVSPDMWPPYLASLRERRIFDGGSAIGAGETFRRNGEAAVASKHLGGYLRVRAESLGAVQELLAGNPVYECGGTVEIRELPRD